MTAENNNTQFIEAARAHGMLSQELARDVLTHASETDVAATVVLQRGLMNAHQVDIIQTLVANTNSIPGYTLLDIIGYGGMGVVFRAQQNTLDREVALKTILVGGRVDESIQRFRKEATSIARLNHPNIVTAYDSGQHDGRIYLSMELVRGQNLSHFVEEHGTLSEGEALSFTRQAALGLAHAWEHGIVHRDIKPDNLLVTHPSEIDQARTIKIADLGLAHLNTDSDATRLTQTGAAVGSPLYMAPEQLSEDKVDCRSDIYSLGSTLYFMLSNRAPFAGDSVAAVLYNKAAGKSIPLTDVANVNSTTRQLVETMMTARPDDRIQNYRSLVSQIDCAMQTAHTQQTTVTASTSPMLPRHQATIVDSALQDTTLVESDPTPAPTERQPNANVPIWIPVCGVLAIAIGTFLVWPSGQTIPTVNQSEIEMHRTWAEPLFSGSSLDGWQSSPGTEMSIENDPVERATALSLNAKQTGMASRRIPIPADTEPWFELETSILLGSSTTGGLLFGTTESSPEFRLSIASDTATLLNDKTEKTLAVQPGLARSKEVPVFVTLRLQPNGWLVKINDSAMNVAPAEVSAQPRVQFFTEHGQTFFTGIIAAGLQRDREAD